MSTAGPSGSLHNQSKIYAASPAGQICVEINRLSLRVPPVALSALFAAAMWFLPDVLMIKTPGGWVVAIVLATLGGAFCIAGVLAFRQAKTTVNPVNPETSTALVVHGVFRLTRNPMYLGFTFLLLAFAVWLGKIPAMLLVPLFMAYLQRFQIRPEEDALNERFGASFDAYRLQVRRWL